MGFLSQIFEEECIHGALEADVEFIDLTDLPP
jgi:hypothetical protein